MGVAIEKKRKIRDNTFQMELKDAIAASMKYTVSVCKDEFF